MQFHSEYEKFNGYDQEMPQSQTTAPHGRDTEHLQLHDIIDTIKVDVKQPALSGTTERT